MEMKCNTQTQRKRTQQPKYKKEKKLNRGNINGKQKKPECLGESLAPFTLSVLGRLTAPIHRLTVL